tara:strand:- start:137156 stop:138385 length:1230 start_codon:yes stop_codon:yes gene_type:complete
MRYRTLYKTLEDHLDQKSYTIITGARQVGKTSLLRQLYTHLKEKEEVAVFLNLENKDVLDSINSDTENVFNRVVIKPKSILEGVSEKRIYLFVDEIQYLDDPTNFLKYLFDEYDINVKVVATGSSAFYIDKKFKDSLAGRKRIFQLYPLSFSEFLVFREERELIRDYAHMVQEPSYVTQYGVDAAFLFREYLTFGGYPAVVLEENRKEKRHILEELKNSYLRRDLIESGVDKEQQFLMLVKLLADQVGQMVNKNELSRTLRIDNKTVERYVYILQKCFHIDMVQPYHKNLRKELTKMSKVYFNDLGMRNAILGRFDLPRDRQDKGEHFENFIYNQLRIKHDAYDIKYWRTVNGHEVDFVIEEGFNQGYALEVKWNCENFRPNKYKKFKETYPEFPLSCMDTKNVEILTY